MVADGMQRASQYFFRAFAISSGQSLFGLEGTQGGRRDAAKGDACGTSNNPMTGIVRAESEGRRDSADVVNPARLATL